MTINEMPKEIWVHETLDYISDVDLGQDDLVEAMQSQLEAMAEGLRNARRTMCQCASTELSTKHVCYELNVGIAAIDRELAAYNEFMKGVK